MLTFLNAPRIFLLTTLPSCLPTLDTHIAAALSSFFFFFLTYRLLSVFQLRCMFQAESLNFIQGWLFPIAFCRPTLKAFSPSSRALTLQMVQRQQGCFPGAHGIPKGLELSRAKGYRSIKKKSPVRAHGPDSVLHRRGPLHVALARHTGMYVLVQQGFRPEASALQDRHLLVKILLSFVLCNGRTWACHNKCDQNIPTHNSGKHY